MKPSKKFYQPKSKPLNPKDLHRVYKDLRKHFGHQNWWPGETPLEVMVGAILTQNTAWTNVEKAILNLKKAGALNLKSLRSIPDKKLAELIMPSGFFNVKAKRLKEFVAFIFSEYQGSLSRMFKESGNVLREKLLAVKGIGRETADSILLYAAGKRFFVIDAYTKRIFSRHRIGLPSAIRKRHRSSHLPGSSEYLQSMDYELWRELFESHLPASIPLYNDFHAQIVATAKVFCKASKVLCNSCPLQSYL